jgi:protoheme IX farnesyltransferase
MMPVVAGITATRRQILVYSFVMALAAVSPWPLRLAGPLYGLSAAVLGFAFVILALRVAANSGSEPSKMGPEKRLFAFSIVYLFALFAALVADRWIPLW